MGNKKNKKTKQSLTKKKNIAKIICSKVTRNKKGLFLRTNSTEAQQPCDDASNRSEESLITLKPIDLQPSATKTWISPTDVHLQDIPISSSSAPEPVADSEATQTNKMKQDTTDSDPTTSSMKQDDYQQEDELSSEEEIIIIKEEIEGTQQSNDFDPIEPSAHDVMPSQQSLYYLTLEPNTQAATTQPAYNITVQPNNIVLSVNEKPAYSNIVIEPVAANPVEAVPVKTNAKAKVSNKKTEKKKGDVKRRQTLPRKAKDYIEHTNNYIHKKLVVIEKSQREILEIVKAQQSTTVHKADRIDTFLKYVGELLRELPTYDSLAIQPKILELIATEKEKIMAVRSITNANRSMNDQ